MEIFQLAELPDTNINYKDLLQTFFEHSSDAMWVKDKSLKLLCTNNAFREYFKFPDECSNRTVETKILKDKQSNVFTVHSTNNQILSVSAIPILKENEVECIFYAAKDISELEELKERFFVSKYQLNAFLENVPKITYMKDLNGQYITGTKYSREFFSEGFDFFHKIQLDCSSIDSARRTFEEKSVIENNTIISYEAEVYDKEGIPHWYTVYKSPINDYNNNVIGIVVMVQNIDDEKLLQAQRETFVASLGHDLKNPTLAQIRAIELLLKGEFGSVSETQQEIMQMILDSCKYMNAMLSSLLATYRNEKGIVKLNYDEILLTDLTEECVSEMIYIAKDKEITITTKIECDIPIIYADKVQIKRVIMNLLSNGIKYAYKNSGITIRIFNELNLTCFTLENKSPFIPAEKREAIFARYVSFAEAHKELGIGLGLYTSKKIVNAHAGDIFVESFQDERTIFGFKIPNVKDSICAAKTVSF